MACLAKIKETREWLSEWMSYRNPTFALKCVERAAVEQRANLNACIFAGRWPEGWSAREYSACVRLLERALPRLRKRAGVRS